MVLKEAFRYQNFLDLILSNATNYLCRTDFVTETKETHNRKKVNPLADDEIIEVKNVHNVDFTANDLIDVVCAVITEKEKLTKAITLAKRSTEIDIDSSVSMNKLKQRISSVFNNMASIKNSETTSRGTGYKFNEAGDQVSYYYDVNSETTINFKRDDVRNLAKKYQKETDEISTKLDAIELTTVVDFVPTWDVTDTFEEVVAACKK